MLDIQFGKRHFHKDVSLHSFAFLSEHHVGEGNLDYASNSGDASKYKRAFACKRRCGKIQKPKKICKLRKSEKPENSKTKLYRDVSWKSVPVIVEKCSFCVARRAGE